MNGWAMLGLLIAAVIVAWAFVRAIEWLAGPPWWDEDRADLPDPSEPPKDPTVNGHDWFRDY